MTVELPNILAVALGERSVEVEARTVAEALDQLRRHRKLGPLIFAESGSLRPHVILFVNEVASRHLPSLAVELAPGDRLAIVQAVSGG